MDQFGTVFATLSPMKLSIGSHETGIEQMHGTNHEFKKILVGVDLAGNDRFVAERLSATTEEALKQAEWLAKRDNAELIFFCVLPLRAEQLSYDGQLLMAEGDDYKSVHDHAREVLAGLASAAAERAVKATSKVVFGTDWVEVIRAVIRADIDLVVAGTRRRGPFHSMFFGSTGLKLLRKCPCPVWITKPGTDVDEHVDSVLVAHDLTDVGVTALELGCSMAKKRGIDLHVLHAIEYQNPASDEVESRKKQAVENEIREQLKQIDIGSNDVRIQVDVGFAEEAILTYINEYDIELIVMGTLARTGVSGMLVGNTAEKLLPFLPCSVLAIKPADFKSPVLL